MRSVGQNFFLNLATTGFSLLFPLITFPYVARVLTAEPFGQFEFANSTANIFLLFAQLGVGLYGTRECARVRDDSAQLAQVSKELFWLTAFTGLLTSLVFVGFVAGVEEFRAQWTLMLVCGLVIPLNIVGVNWYFAGTEQFGYIAVRTLLVKVAVVVGMFVFVRSPDDCLIWAIVSVVGNGGAYVVNFAKMRSQLDLPSVRALELRRHVRPMLGFFLAMASISLYSTVGSMLLGILSSNSEVGYFSAALKIKNVLVAVMTSLTGVLVARTSYYVGERNIVSYGRVVSRSVHFAIVVVVYLSGFFGLFAGSLVRVLAGSGFSAAVLPVRLMMFAAVAIGCSSITANEILTPLGKERYLSISYVLAGALGLVLNLVLIPRWGAVGAAVATMMAEALVAVIQGAIVLRVTFVSRRVLFDGTSACFASVAIAWCIAGLVRVLMGDCLFAAVVAGCLSLVVMVMVLIALNEDMTGDLLRALKRRFFS